MTLRKLTALTLLLSFSLLMLTSLVLFVVPEGRVAYWSDWHWLGLSKKQWGDIHTTSGFLFLCAGMLHLFHNWKPLLNALKKRGQQMHLLAPSLLAALAINLLVVAGTLLQLPPFSSLLDWGQGFKNAAAVTYGEPPYGHAERSSLRLFAKRTGLDLQAIKANLAKAGIAIGDDEQSILTLAKVNALTPKAVYDAMQPSAQSSPSAAEPLPTQPVPGMGQTPLSQLCRTYGLEQERVLSFLAGKGITAAPQLTLKEIAAAHGTDPHSLYELLHDAFAQQ